MNPGIGNPVYVKRIQKQETGNDSQFRVVGLLRAVLAEDSIKTKYLRFFKDCTCVPAIPAQP